MGIILGACSTSSRAEDYFNPNALSNIDSSNLADFNNLEQFASPGSQMPGKYTVEVSVNNKLKGARNIDFIFNDKTHQLEPVLTKEILKDWGVKTDVLPTLKNLPDETPITEIGNYIEYATTQFIFSKQLLKVNIPQVALNVAALDRVDPALFDQGMPAIILDYDFNGARTWYKNDNLHRDERFLGLRSGVNLGAWRLRNYSTYDYSSGQNHWNSVNTYLERDIQPLNSQLTIGETVSNGTIFDSFQLKGVKLVSDESMIPYSQRGFAPVVRGFAQSNAKVTVRQNGSIIYQTYVAPGPFALNDLYPSSYSGNLNVTVEEEDGTKNSFVVPFSSLAIMQREGGIKFSATLGQYRPMDDKGKHSNFLQGTLIYGLPWNTTLFGGALLSNDYQSYALGVGVNFGNFGAISIDGKHALAKLNGESETKSGQAYRIQYSKTVQETNSTISMEASRFSSKNFYNFSEANEYRLHDFDLNKRSRYQFNLSQSLGRYGSLYISGYQQDHWQSPKKDRTFNLGYNVIFNKVSFGLTYGYTVSNLNNNRYKTNQVSFRVNILLDKWLPGRHYLTSSFNYSGNGKSSIQSGLSGNALDNKLSYSVQQNYERDQHNTSGYASASYQGSSGNAHVGYAYTDRTKRFNYGVQGGVVIHPYGVTLSQSLGESIAVVAAPGAKDIALQNAQGVTTDRRGYAVKPYLTPYADNRISLNINDLGDDVDIVQNTTTVIPTKGAVVLAKIDTRVGNRILLTLTHNEKPLPFGAVVTYGQDNINSIVGDNGEVYLSGMPEQGELIAKWGPSENQTCKVNYELPKSMLSQSIKVIKAPCI